jgi:RNA polymerase sigma-70 factor (ECF subfamily)
MTIYHPDFRFLPEEAPDIREFEAFWRRVYGRLHRLVERRYDAADADEIVQETMLRCYENWSRLDPGRDAWPWLTVVARRIATDHARARTRRADLETAAVPPLVDPSRPDEEVCARELTETVRRALHAMPDADRTVLSLHHLDGMPTAEIANLTGRTDTAVRQHLFRARPRLAVVLRRLLDGPAGMLAPVGVWLRRWRKALAGAVPGAGTVAVCCLSVMTAVTVGVGLDGHRYPGTTTAPNRVAAQADRPERHVTAGAGRAAVATAAGEGARAVRPVSPGRAEPTDPSAPPVEVDLNETPFDDPEGERSHDVYINAIPGHRINAGGSGSSTPGYTEACRLDAVECPNEHHG